MKSLAILGSAFLSAQSADAVPAYWLAGVDGYAGPNPVLAGHESGHAIHVCRVNGAPGKLHSITGRCYIGWYRQEYGHRTYEVLQDPERRLIWVHRNQVTANRLFIGGSENGTKLHVCRVGGSSGKLVGGLTGVCFYGWYGREMAAHDFDVLAFP